MRLTQLFLGRAGLAWLLTLITGDGREAYPTRYPTTFVLCVDPTADARCRKNVVVRSYVFF